MRWRGALMWATELGLIARAFAAPITSAAFGTLPDGREAHLYTLTSRELSVAVTDYGARVVSIVSPDRNGTRADVALGFDRLDGYLGDHSYFGAIVGRYANRIAAGRFSLDGHPYTLATNNGANHLHGGRSGFDQQLWHAQIEAGTLALRYRSQAGEEGYPGNLDVEVRYRLRGRELSIEYRASTDADTIINLTNHSYFNLSGDPRHSIVDESLLIAADRYTPVDRGLIPTGRLASVAGTPFDFRRSRPIGASIEDRRDEQIVFGRGYDHNWVLNDQGDSLHFAARVEDPASGRALEISTTQPGLQLYSGNFLDGTTIGKGDVAYAHRSGLCLEAQHFPDSPNHAGFPSTRLRRGQSWRALTVYRFLVTGTAQ